MGWSWGSAIRGGYMMLPQIFGLEYSKGIAFLDLSRTILQSVAAKSESSYHQPQSAAAVQLLS